MYDYPMMPGAGFLFLAVIVGLIGGVMMFLLPFFVYRIRKETIETNRKFDRLLSYLESEYKKDKGQEDTLSVKINR